MTGRLFKEGGDEAACTRREEVRELEFSGDDLFFSFGPVLGVEGGVPGEKFEAEHPKAPEVCVGVVGHVLDDFRWDVVWSAAVSAS